MASRTWLITGVSSGTVLDRPISLEQTRAGYAAIVGSSVGPDVAPLTIRLIPVDQ